MRQLSVFAGGWTLNAAQVVCDGDVMNLLNSLVTKSLIVMNQRVETGIRFSFHETVRQYAHEKLLEVAGLEALCGKHLAYFVRLAEQAERELYRADQVRWLGKLADDIDNLRKSLDWALITNPELGLRLLVSLRLFWEARGDLKEVESWMKQFLGHYTTSDPLRAHALAVYSKVLVDRNAFAEAQKLASQSLEIAKMVSDKRVEAFSLWALGVSIGFQRDVRQGIPYLEQSLASYESLGDKLGQATALDWLSMDQSDKEQSKAFILNSLKLYRELGHLSGIAMCLADLASMLIDMGDFSSLLPLLEESLAIYRQLESYQGEAWVLTLYGRLAFWNGDYRNAYDYFEQSISLYERSSVSWSAWPRAFIANIFLRQGNIVQARKLFESNLQQVQKGDNVICLVYIVEGLASLYTKDGLLPRALQLYSWTNIMREKLGTLRPPAEQKIVERDLTVIHANLDNSEFASISEEGRAMTMEQAVALALVSSVPGANY